MKIFSQFTRKNVMAVALGPLAIIPASFLLAYAEVVFRGQSVQVALGELFPLYVVVGLPIGYLVTFIVGIPTVLVLNKLNKLSLLNITSVWLVPLSIFSLFQEPIILFWAFFTFPAFAVTVGCWRLYKLVV
ncbi:hypothetical protein [Teredinibacter purpureus]|uniref:hypothetical protein n=1 Tax=Teredinibacter purpureus TaxID=2731756 RepID=UPI0005F769CB|nr:hypothetical protein [Teredinibacter purpureus]